MTWTTKDWRTLTPSYDIKAKLIKNPETLKMQKTLLSTRNKNNVLKSIETKSWSTHSNNMNAKPEPLTLHN